MSSSNFYKCKHIYIELLPFFVSATSLLGFMTGLTSTKHDNKPIEGFTNIIGYTTIGIITGITYPISYPLLGLYTTYNNIK